MKNLAIILFVSVGLISRTHAQKASASDYLDINNIKMLVYSNSEIVLDTSSNHSTFEVPKGSGKNTMYEAGIWAMGINARTKDTHGLAIFNNPDLVLQEGPVSNSYNSAWKSRYGKLWKVTKAQIDYHKLMFTSPGYTSISVITDWPAHGDTSNGEPFHLAPFIDINSNGIYDPSNGDYPCIKGDQAIYTIAHDDGSINLHNSLPFPMDVHLMAYSFSASNALNNTVFLEYRLVNRSPDDYRDFRFAIFQDLDIGCPYDDHIGCDTVLNAFYGYNGDNYDELNCRGISGYGINPPVMGTMFLNHLMSSFVYFNNSGNINGNPAFEKDYYNYMNATWRNGLHMVKGGNGIPGTPGATGQKTNYMYSGNPDDSLTWTDISAGNPPYDRRGLGSVGPYNFTSGSQLNIDLALVYSRDTTKNYIENVNTFKNDAAVVKQFYMNQNFNCPFWATGIKTQNTGLTFSLYPNPARNEVHLEWTTNDKVAVISAFDSQGRKIFEHSPRDENSIILNVEKWSGGFHLLRIESENGVIVKKLIVE